MKNKDPSFFKTTEGFVFLLGCGFLITEIILFILFGPYIPQLKEHLLPVILADLLGGRGASISLGLQLGLSQFQVAFISVVFNLTYLFILYPLIMYFYEQIIELKFIGKVFSLTERTAEKHQSKIEKWGALGIAVFVWVPLFSTGSLVGAIIGTLIGMRTSVVICVVILAMVTSAVSWAFAFDHLFEFAAGAGKIIPSIFVGLILGIVVFHRLYQLYHLAKQKIKSKKDSPSDIHGK
ncbi:MAG: small multi-drug export protein [bacterium]